jgi:hypothetical protein
MDESAAKIVIESEAVTLLVCELDLGSLVSKRKLI